MLKQQQKQQQRKRKKKPPTKVQTKDRELWRQNQNEIAPDNIEFTANNNRMKKKKNKKLMRHRTPCTFHYLRMFYFCIVYCSPRLWFIALLDCVVALALPNGISSSWDKGFESCAISLLSSVVIGTEETNPHPARKKHWPPRWRGCLSPKQCHCMRNRIVKHN